MFLNLREMAEVTGFSRSRMLAIVKRDGFPLFEGKITLQDFQAWYPTQLTASPKPRSQDERLLPLRSNASRPVVRRVPVRRHTAHKK